MFSNLWKISTLGAGILFVLAMGWALRLEHLRAGWQDKYTTLDGQSQSVLMATQQATNNPGLKWPGVPAQITALASSNIELKSSIDGQNSTIAQMSADYQTLKAQGNALRSQLTVAQTARASFVARLEAMALTPGDHQNCPALLSQTQDALDLAYGSGL